jgi:hypothetical protein
VAQNGIFSIHFIGINNFIGFGQGKSFLPPLMQPIVQENASCQKFLPILGQILYFHFLIRMALKVVPKLSEFGLHKIGLS